VLSPCLLLPAMSHMCSPGPPHSHMCSPGPPHSHMCSPGPPTTHTHLEACPCHRQRSPVCGPGGRPAAPPPAACRQLVDMAAAHEHLQCGQAAGSLVSLACQHCRGPCHAVCCLPPSAYQHVRFSTVHQAAHQTPPFSHAPTPPTRPHPRQHTSAPPPPFHPAPSPLPLPPPPPHPNPPTCCGSTSVQSTLL
jgi:hypothetical protein